MTIKAKKKIFGKNRKTEKKQKKTTTFFFNPETEPDPDRKPTFEQKTDPDPDRLPKVNPAGLYFILLAIFFGRQIQPAQLTPCRSAMMLSIDFMSSLLSGNHVILDTAETD
jgi:hypothetical protein